MIVNNKNVFLLLTLILPIAIFYITVYFLAVDIPRGDDYDIFLNYLLHPLDTRVQLLFSQHNEHRVAFSRIMAEGMCFINGELNFRYLIFIGNAALIFIFLIVFTLFRKTKISLYYLLPIPYVFFLSRIWENTSWATGSLQNYYVVLFSFLALYFFNQKNPWYFLVSLLFALIAVYTSGSGIIVLPILLVWAGVNVFISAKKSENQFSFLIDSSGVRFIFVFFATLFVAFLYFSDYTKPLNHPSIIDSIFFPINTIHYFFLFMGSYIPIKIGAFIAGALSTALFIFLVYKRYYIRSPVIFGMMVFLMLNACAAALTRSGFGAEQAISSKYVIISVLLLVLFYISVLETFQRPKFLKKNILLALFVILSVGSIVAFRVQMQWLFSKQDGLVMGMQNWSKDGSGFLFYPDQNKAGKILNEASKQGLYHSRKKY